MKHTFNVTGLGLQVDKAMLMPGSTLILSQPAPGHWSRFGEPGMSEEAKLVVATPAAAVSGDDDFIDALADKLIDKMHEKAEAEYEGALDGDEKATEAKADEKTPAPEPKSAEPAPAPKASAKPAPKGQADK